MNTTNIYAFSERMLCEYNSIFPTIAALLDHLLFTIGNGYEVDEVTGMLVDFDGTHIDEYPKLSDEDWEKLIADGHKKEDEYFSTFSKDDKEPSIFLEYLAAQKARYVKKNVTEDMFTEDSLYKDLLAQAELLKKETLTDPWLRPYPLSRDYSRIYYLNENTPTWFLEIAINFCKAWVRFLTNEIDTKNVCVSEKSDYSDLTWTTQHRGMILELSENLIQFKNSVLY